MEPEPSKETLLKQAADLRGQAERARRLAGSLLEGKDRTTLLTLGQELEDKADRMEKQAAGLSADR